MGKSCYSYNDDTIPVYVFVCLFQVSIEYLLVVAHNDDVIIFPNTLDRASQLPRIAEEILRNNQSNTRISVPLSIRGLL